MAKPIEIGLVLEGEDARRFDEYMKNPTYPKETKERLKKAAQRAGIPIN
jgi:hypothetical protein